MVFSEGLGSTAPPGTPIVSMAYAHALADGRDSRDPASRLAWAYLAFLECGVHSLAILLWIAHAVSPSPV
jgi:hypothetical protein